MNLALALYNKVDGQSLEEVEQSVGIVKNHLDLLAKFFHKFDSTDVNISMRNKKSISLFIQLKMVIRPSIGTKCIRRYLNKRRILKRMPAKLYPKILSAFKHPRGSQCSFGKYGLHYH